MSELNEFYPSEPYLKTDDKDEFLKKYMGNSQKEFDALVLKGISFSIVLPSAPDNQALEKLLPSIPEGYYWNEDSGGLRDHMSFTYKVWRNKFGYMPQSE